MAHKKEIYTAVIKILPSSNSLIDRQISLENYNRLAAAFYHLFNSAILTKGDYSHILGVLAEKLPVYEAGADADTFASLASSYAEFGYPENPDIRRVITDFVQNIEGIPVTLVTKAVYAIREKTKVASDFVGIELHTHGFTLTPLTESEFNTIKSIILVK